MDIGPSHLRRIGILAIAAAVVLCPVLGLSASRVDAIALVSTTPADGAALVTSPPQLIATFDSPISSAFTMQVACNGTPPTFTQARASEDALSLIIDVSATPLPKGDCHVAWTVQGVNEPGAITGAFSFTIQQDTVLTQAGAVPTGTDAAAAASGSATGGATATDGSDLSGPLGLFRLLSTIALAALFGALVLITVAWPEGVEYILTIRFLRYAWIVATAATWVMVACIVADTKGTGFTRGLIPTNWGPLKDSTPGIAVLGRVILVAGAGWVAIRPERVIDPTTQLVALALPGLAVATLGFSRTGGEFAVVGYAAGVVHALAMAVWLGGLILLARVVLAGPGEDDLVHAVRGFGRLSTPAMLLTVVSGAAQLYRLDRGHLLDTTHGRLLLLKVVPVVGMVFVGVATRQFVHARLTRAEALSAPIAGKLRRAIGMEALIGVVVLAITSWMLSTQPANLSAAGSTADFRYVLPLKDPNGKLDATIYVTPGKVGQNAVLVVIDKPVTGISNFTVRFDPPPNAAVSPVVITVIEFPVGVTGWYLPITEGIPLPAAGQWTVTLTVTSADGPFVEGGPLDVVDTTTSNNPIPEVSLPVVTSPSTTTTIAAAP